MSKKATARLDDALSSQLSHLKKYSQLLDAQQELIERKDFEGLRKIMDRKDRVLARLGGQADLNALALEAKQASGEERDQTAELFFSLTEKLDNFAAQEAQSVEKTAGLKTELARNIFTLRKGKRMLRKYSQAHPAGKARFKDLTG